MEDARVARERRRQGVGERREDRREDRADRDRPPDHPRRGGVRSVGVAGAEHPPDDHLARDRDRVEDERDEEEELVGDLVRADLGVAHPREDGRGDEEARVERGGADEDLAPDAHHRLHLAPARPARGRVRAEQLDDERDAHPRLRDRGSRRASRRFPSGSRRRRAPRGRGSRRSRRRRSRAAGAGSRRRGGSPAPRARRARRGGRSRRSGST